MERSIYYGQVIHMQFLNTFFHAHMTRLFIARMTHSGLPWPADLYIGQTQPLHSKFCCLISTLVQEVQGKKKYMENVVSSGH